MSHPSEVDSSTRWGPIAWSLATAAVFLLGLPLRAEIRPVPARDAAQEGGGKARPAEGQGRKKSGPEFLELEKGIEKVRAKHLPALVWYPASAPAAVVDPSAAPKGDADKGADGPPAAAEMAKAFEEYLAVSSFRSLVERFVLIRIEDADVDGPYPAAPPVPGPEAEPPPKDAKAPPPPAPVPAAAPKLKVGEALRLPKGVPALLLLDFREQVLVRFDGTLPKRSIVQAKLEEVLRHNAFFSAQARPVEKRLDESLKASKARNWRQAVLLVKDLELPAERRKLDPVLLGRIDALVKHYRAQAKKVFDEAAKLEGEGDKMGADSHLKYERAMKSLDRIGKEFPFKDLMVDANKRRGRIWTKMTGLVSGGP